MGEIVYLGFTSNEQRRGKVVRDGDVAELAVKWSLGLGDGYMEISYATHLFLCMFEPLLEK